MGGLGAEKCIPVFVELYSVMYEYLATSHISLSVSTNLTFQSHHPFS